MRRGDEPSTITPRMLAILRAVAEHDTYSDAARWLGVSYQTVQNTLVTVRRRMQVATNAQAMRKLGWLRLPEEGTRG